MPPPRAVLFQVDPVPVRWLTYWCGNGAGEDDSTLGESGSTELCGFSSHISSRLPMTIFKTLPFAGSTSMTSLERGWLTLEHGDEWGGVDM